MRRLIPDPGPTDLLSEIQAYRPLEESRADRPFVAVNMVSTLDGRAAVEGSSKPLGSDADSAFLLELRTRFDAVMIGAGTMRAEGYGRIIASPERRERRSADGLEPDALAVIVSGDLDLPFSAPLFTDGNGRVIIFSNQSEAPETATPTDLITGDGGTLDLADALRHLRREEGVRALLCEGGPHVLAQLVAADLVDDLFLTTTPVMTGGEAPRIIEPGLPEPARFELAYLAEADGDLFARYRRS